MVLLPSALANVQIGVRTARHINPTVLYWLFYLLLYRLAYNGMLLTGSKLVWDAWR